MVNLGKFPRVDNLPLYVLEEVTKLMRELRQSRIDVINLGMGNPDRPTPRPIVEKLIEAARKTANQRYSMSIGVPKLREQIANLYWERYGVKLDPETEVITTIGAKDGLGRVLQGILNPSGEDRVVSTNPAYPIHYYAILFADGKPVMLPLVSPDDFLNRLEDLYRRMAPKKPRALLISFPHNPTTMCVNIDFFRAIITMAVKHGTMVIHDFAYSDGGFDGYKPPSILQVEGAKEIAVEIRSLSKSYNMAGWRVGFLLGNARMVGAARKIKSYMDYGIFQAIQIASIIALRDCKDEPAKICAIQQERRNVFLAALARNADWVLDKPGATMFVNALIPEGYRNKGSLEFSKWLLEKAHVACAPGVGFVHGQKLDSVSRRLGEEHVRFALIEPPDRLKQAARNIGCAFKGRPLGRQKKPRIANRTHDSVISA